MSRGIEYIAIDLTKLERQGIIRDVLVHGQMPGRRWVFTPKGFAERSFTTSQVEDFILGAKAVLNTNDPERNQTSS
jgi:hypothetical protein